MNKIFLVFLFVLSACATAPRGEEAYSLASSNNLLKTQIPTNVFMLTSFERIHSPDNEAHIYIEGDGLAWASKRTPSRDPTPKNPIALKLATQDTAPNVIYLARPCQYSRLVTKGRCPKKYWTSHRFAPEVISAFDTALQALKEKHHITGFHLIGFSGGGNVAALLSAQRNDILSLRTVAGNLDHELLHQAHDVSQIPNSLNAKNIARSISHIPQYHFIGQTDKIVPPSIAQSFIRASESTACIQSEIVAGTSHRDGWASLWPALLRRPISCT